MLDTEIKEGYRAIPKFYSTNALTYILYLDKVIDFVETIEYTKVESEEGGKKTVTTKEKKIPKATIERECLKKINNHNKFLLEANAEIKKGIENKLSLR